MSWIVTGSSPSRISGPRPGPDAGHVLERLAVAPQQFPLRGGGAGDGQLHSGGVVGRDRHRQPREIAGWLANSLTCAAATASRGPAARPRSNHVARADGSVSCVNRGSGTRFLFRRVEEVQRTLLELGELARGHRQPDRRLVDAPLTRDLAQRERPARVRRAGDPSPMSTGVYTPVGVDRSQHRRVHPNHVGAIGEADMIAAHHGDAVIGPAGALGGGEVLPRARMVGVAVGVARQEAGHDEERRRASLGRIVRRGGRGDALRAHHLRRRRLGHFGAGGEDEHRGDAAGNSVPVVSGHSSSSSSRVVRAQRQRRRRQGVPR